MWILTIFLLVIILLVIFEYRFRRPDQIVIGESKGLVVRKKSRFYARHFSLPIPGIIHSEQIEIEMEAKGKLAVKIKLALSVAASPDHLTELVRAGGWNADLVNIATKELVILLETTLKDYCEKTEIEKLAAESINKVLLNKFGDTISELGLQIISIKVQAVEPVDDTITEALRQKESARILEDTQKENFKVQIATAEAEVDAEEQISILNHQLELKKIDLKQKAFEQETLLDEKRTQEEIKRRKMQLEFDRKEMELLKDNPELLILSPQMTRLAEASQSLKNARTVVSLSPNEMDQGSQILGMLQSFMQNMLQKSSASAKTKK